MSRIYLTPEEALKILPEGDMIHTFFYFSLCIFGVDMERSEVEDKIRTCGYREITGSTARSMKHGLALWNDGDRQIDVLFVETNMEELDRLYPEEDE